MHNILCEKAQKGDKMNWFRRWPGNGPFSDLPPWERPGWVYGRGWCLNYWRNNLSTTSVSEKESLEAEKSYLEERIKEIEKRLKELEEKSKS
ncbi:MAG: DUF5320 domain-containing protein [Candidatus Micrarchaeia archaeon]